MKLLRQLRIRAAPFIVCLEPVSKSPTSLRQRLDSAGAIQGLVDQSIFGFAQRRPAIREQRPERRDELLRRITHWRRLRSVASRKLLKRQHLAIVASHRVEHHRLQFATIFKESRTPEVCAVLQQPRQRSLTYPTQR
jgi:hypothetical protein